VLLCVGRISARTNLLVVVAHKMPTSRWCSPLSSSAPRHPDTVVM
jgi:hypothetical protein